MLPFDGIADPVSEGLSRPPKTNSPRPTPQGIVGVVSVELRIDESANRGGPVVAMTNRCLGGSLVPFGDGFAGRRIDDSEGSRGNNDGSVVGGSSDR